MTSFYMMSFPKMVPINSQFVLVPKLLFSKLCQHNLYRPKNETGHIIMATDQEILDEGSQELVWHHHSLST